MMAVAVWLLITVSHGNRNYGNVTVVDRFPSAQECEKVRFAIRGLDKSESAPATCVQAVVFANAANVVNTK